MYHRTRNICSTFLLLILISILFPPFAFSFSVTSCIFQLRRYYVCIEYYVSLPTIFNILRNNGFRGWYFYWCWYCRFKRQQTWWVRLTNLTFFSSFLFYHAIFKLPNCSALNVFFCFFLTIITFLAMLPPPDIAVASATFFSNQGIPGEFV